MDAFQCVGGSGGWLDLNSVQIRHFSNHAVKQTGCNQISKFQYDVAPRALCTFRNFVNVRRFSQKLQARKLNRIKRETMARYPRTKWWIWACDVTPTSRMGLLPDRSNWGLRIRQEFQFEILTINVIYENFKLKLCMCAQSMALGTRTKFRLEILIRSTISAIHKFRENILESSRIVSETTPRPACTSTRAWRTCWDACRCRRASSTQVQEYPPPLPLGTADPATVRRESDPRIIGDHPGAGVPTR